MYIERNITDELLNKLIESNKIIVLYGARQLGKTTLCKQIISKSGLKTLEVNADQAKYQDVLSSRDFNRLSSLVYGYQLLFIDEAQRIPGLGLNLKILRDELPELKILVTGSSSISIAKDISETLTGRKLTYNLYPISVKELGANKNDFETLDLINDLLIYGAYPEIIKTKNIKDKEELLYEISNSYLYKDILEMANIQYPHKIKNLLKLLAFQVGAEVSILELSKSLGINRETIERYIDLLEKSFVIYKLNGYSNNLRKEIKKQNKYYFYDLGIRNCIIGDFKYIEQRNDIGALWENFVINERKKYLSYNRIFAESYFWRTYTGAELDYIESSNNILNGYEIKYSKKNSKPPQTFVEKYPNATYNLINKENILEFI